MTIAIVDDEKAIREGLIEMLQSSGVAITAIHQADNVADGINLLQSHAPDVLLLDVEIGKKTGFDLLRELSDYSFQLIFITAHNEYALQAFKFSAIDYLLKPVDPDELHQSIRRAEERIREHYLAQQITVLRDSLESLKSSEKKIVLRDNESLHFVRIADIIKCEAEGSYTRFFMSNAKPLLISRSLKEYESLLAPHGFVRTHHSFIVNIHRIVRFDKNNGGILILENNLSAPVSQRKKEYILSVLESDI